MMRSQEIKKILNTSFPAVYFLSERTQHEMDDYDKRVDKATKALIVITGGVMKIVVQKNKRRRWFWKVVAANGRILAVSEDYTRKGSCYDTVHRLGVAKVEEKKS